MDGINIVVIGGRLTRSPELRYTPKGSAVCNFTLACNSYRKNAQGEKEKTTAFVDVVVWGKSGEAAGQHLDKGDECLIEGRLNFNSWEKDGKRHSKLEVFASRCTFGAKKKRDNGEGGEFEGGGYDDEFSG